MLIKDEPYVAAMLTSPEKYKRDRRRYNVNPADGDRIIYRHFNQPEFVLFGRALRLPPIKTRDWQLRFVARARFLRKLFFPHREERAFRDWYMGLVDRFDWQGDRDYTRWLSALSAPADVTGYREIRYPRMLAARRRADGFLATRPDDFEPHAPATSLETRNLKPETSSPIPLPLLAPAAR